MKKLKIVDINLINNNINIQYTIENYKNKNITKELFGKSYIVGTEKVLNTVENGTASFELDIEFYSDFFNVLKKIDFENNIDYLETRDHSKIIMKKELQTFLYDIDNLYDYQLTYVNHKNRTANDFIKVNYTTIHVNIYRFEKEVEKYLENSYQNHKIYVHSLAVSIYKPLDFELIGSFGDNTRLHSYPLSVRLKLETGKYFVEQPEYYKNFNFFGSFNSKETDMLAIEEPDIDRSINSHEAFSNKLNKCLEVLNK
jgi:hypothetical protein